MLEWVGYCFDTSRNALGQINLSLFVNPPKSP
jgi:hypothetical protein